MKRFLTRDRAAPNAAPNGQSNGQSIFVTGGIGDVIALSCFLDVPPNLETIYYATRKRADVEAFLATLCPPTTKHVSVWNDWSERWGWFSLPEFLRSATSDSSRSEEPLLIGATDWSISSVFERELPFRGLPWAIGHPLSSIHDVRLPKRYAVFQPFSTDKQDFRRDFTREELRRAIAHAANNDMPLVLLNAGNDPPLEKSLNLINLQNKTNLYGSIDITLGASLYIGVDSSMSQVATKVLPENKLLIKSTNYRHYYRHLNWYAAPHTTFDFVGPDPISLLSRLEWSES